MKKTDLAWVAGFIDGEGSLYMVKNNPRASMKNPHYQIQMGISNTELVLIERVKSILGGYIQKPKAKWLKQGYYYRWFTTSAQMLPTLELIYPYLVSKRKRIAEILIQFQKDTQRIHRERINEKRARGFFKQLPPEEVLRRNKIWEEIHLLNMKGEGYRGRET